MTANHRKKQELHRPTIRPGITHQELEQRRTDKIKLLLRSLYKHIGSEPLNVEAIGQNPVGGELA